MMAFLVKRTGPICLALVNVIAGRPADEIWMDFKIFKTFHRLNYLDFYFVNISAMVLTVLEVHFSLLFSHRAYFRACFEVHKIWLPLYSCQSLY